MTPPDSTASRGLTRPVERYGSRPGWVRPLVVALAAVLAVVGGGWLGWAALYHSDPPVASRVDAFEVMSSSEVRVTIAIERDAGTAVACVIKAQAGDHAVVGEREVLVPAGPETTLTHTYAITTERAATSATAEGCRAVEGRSAQP